MSDTLFRGKCSNDLAWEIQSWTPGKVDLEIVEADDRNASPVLVTLLPAQARELAAALLERARQLEAGEP